MPRALERRLLLGLVVGALLRLALLPLPGTPDVGSWKAWTFVGAYDITSIYGVGGSPPERGLIRWGEISGTTEYPPLGLYEMAAVGQVYKRLDPSYADSRTLTALVKTPGILAEAVLVVWLLVWGRRRWGAEPATWMALAIWLNPAIVLGGAALGYLDAAMAVPAIAALLAAGTGHPAVAGVLLAGAALTKAQAVFVAPVILLAVWHSDPPRRTPAVSRFVFAGLATAAVLVLPFVTRGAWWNMVQAIGRLAAHDMLSGYALNSWWIVTWLVRAFYAVADLGFLEAFTTPVRILQISRLVEIGLFDPKPIASAVVVGLVGWGLWRRRRESSTAGLAFLGGWCVFTYFMFGVQVHENHLYLAVPFFVVAGGLEPGYRPACWIVAGITAANMYLFYGVGDGAWLLLDRSLIGIDLTVPAAMFNVGAWAWVTRRITAQPSSLP